MQNLIYTENILPDYTVNMGNTVYQQSQYRFCVASNRYENV